VSGVHKLLLNKGLEQRDFLFHDGNRVQSLLNLRSLLRGIFSFLEGEVAIVCILPLSVGLCGRGRLGEGGGGSKLVVERRRKLVLDRLQRSSSHSQATNPMASAINTSHETC
jgi:hypothetical protein